MKYCKLYLILLSTLVFSSCASILGIHNPKAISTNETIKYSNKLKINTNCYSINPEKFKEIYNSLKINSSLDFDKLYQPLQLIVFNKKRENICHLVNCNIGGFPLKWNRYNSFDKVPVVANGFKEPNYKVQYNEIFNYIEENPSNIEIEKMFEKYDYIYFIYYAKFTNGLTKPFIKLLKKYKQKNSEEKIMYIFINTDNLIYALTQSDYSN